MKRLNKAFLWLHRWTGIVFAIVFIVVGLSGSLLTFRYEIQQIGNPEELRTGLSAVDWPDFVRVAASISEEIPKARVAFLQMNPAKPDFPMRVVVQMPDASVEVHYAHPLTGRLVESDINESFWRTMRDLHIFLLQGVPGLLIVFLSGWVLIACSLLGTWLWAPRLKKPRIALGVRWRASLRKLMLDLHNVTGFYVLLPMLLLALTGVTLILARLSPTELPEPQIEIDASVESPNAVIAGEEALSNALSAVAYGSSGQVIRQIRFPTEGQPWFAFDVEDPGQGTQTLFTDGLGSALLLTLTERNLSLWNRLKAELGVAIHEGYILGNAGRWLVFVCGLTLSMGSATGVWLWLVRRKTRKPARSDVRAAEAPG